MRCGGGAGDCTASPSPASHLSVAPWREKQDQNTLPGHTETEHGYLCKQNRRPVDCAWCFIRDDSEVGQGLMEHALKVAHKSQKARIGVDRASGDCPLRPHRSLLSPNLASSSFESGIKAWSPGLPGAMKGEDRNDGCKGEGMRMGGRPPKLLLTSSATQACLPALRKPQSSPGRPLSALGRTTLLVPGPDGCQGASR